jgi:hypothetical protein
MNILSGIISIGISFWMYIYLYGLKAVSSAMYAPGFNIFPTIMLLISFYCFYREFKKNNVS